MTRKIIIPCAGLGTRMKMKKNESKEMYCLPGDDKPIIEHALRFASIFNAEPIIMSRKEKKDLNSYLRAKKIKPKIIVPKGEWMDTVRASAPYWGESNLLILPDTRYAPCFDSINNIFFSLEEMKTGMAFAIHKVKDGSKWCVKGHDDIMIEKPKDNDHTGYAFGLVGWEKGMVGWKFWQELALDKQAYIPARTPFFPLTFFEDYTRGEHSLTKYKE